MTSFLDEAGIKNMLPRPNIATQSPTRTPTRAPTLAPTRAPTLAPTLAPTRAPTRAPTLTPISPQLTTAANLTKTPAPTTITYIVPVATPGPITSTPAPLPTYQGPQDDLLFDPDPLEGDDQGVLGKVIRKVGRSPHSPQEAPQPGQAPPDKDREGPGVASRSAAGEDGVGNPLLWV